MMISEGLSTEVIEHQVLRRNTEIVEHLLDSFTHRAGTTHVVFDVFRSFMVLQISFVNHVVYETCRILHTGCVCSRVRTVERQVEFEVREIFLNLQKSSR